MADRYLLSRFSFFPAGSGLLRCCGTAIRVRLVAVDRPGYGLSDFVPQRRISDWPDDVLQLTRSLGDRRFAVMGVSGGGPYALACAWKMPEKLSAVKIVGGLAPLDRPETLRAMRWYTG